MDSNQESRKELNQLVLSLTPVEIYKAQAIFVTIANRAGASLAFYQANEPKVWSLIDRPPNADNAYRIHIMWVEVMIDLIKRAKKEIKDGN